MEKLTAKEKWLVNAAWKQLKKFINDWKHSPCKWDNERDVQAELASRLRQAYEKLNVNDYDAKYETVEKLGGVPRKEQLWSRVSCEPRIYYTNKKVRRCSKPDIVIFRDLEDPDHPPDDHPYSKKQKKQNRPILWLCEIKYNTEATPTNNITDINNNDEKDWGKLSSLRNHNETAYACWLVLSRRKDTSGGEQYPKSGRFRKYFIKLPSKMLKTLRKE